ncbi:NAD(P)H-binding protein [Yinghuangia sp. YIM S09857]|uniref:NAD(P)H-binding protein n=1 Tax=Yinghuangia sp. YIM S09857 TaxID=3436929 RepID=UPI003F539381
MIVVTGATGNVGRALVGVLAADGRPVTATSRGITEADVPPGAIAKPADLIEVDTLRPLFEGARALFLQSGGASAHRLDARAVAEAAKSAGIEHIVLLSSQGVATRPESGSHGGIAAAIEDAVRESGVDWTILRPGGFASNTFAWAEPVRTRRAVAAPFGDVGLPVIDPLDIAEVAAAALLGDGHDGQTYELTGPEPTTPRQRAEVIGAALGEPVAFVEQTRGEARAEMLRFMPEDVVDTTLAILGEPTEGERRVSPDVRRVLGREPRPFADWVVRNVGAFR